MNFFHQNPNLVKILAVSLIIILICLVVTTKINSKNSPADESGKLSIIKSYQEKLPKTTKSPYQLVMTGTRLLNNGESEMAISTLNEATIKDQKYRDGWLYLGVAFLKNNAGADAVKALEKAQKIDPIYADTYKYLSSAYTQTGETSKAEECYNKFKAFTINN